MGMIELITGAKKKREVIIGCGRLGAGIAEALSRKGDEVTVIDLDESAFKRLPFAFCGDAVVGDGTDLSVLKGVKTECADAVIAATDSDSANVMIAQAARLMSPEVSVVARLRDPERGALCGGMRIRTICPAELAVSEASRMIADERSA